MAAVAVWFWLSSPGKRPPRANATPPKEAVEAAPPPEPVRPAPPARPSAAERPSAEPPDDGLNVVGPHPDDPHEPGMHPHPFTPEHKRIYAINALNQRLDDLMSFRKAKEMREALVEYEKLDPEDVEKMRAGYAIIADCIEYPGDRSLAAARHFYDTERHSTLRRFVRRVCFENQQFP
ncbi:MAG TPA: hypothetical protein VFZ53_01880 [Polyangiaceae bacterium]